MILVDERVIDELYKNSHEFCYEIGEMKDHFL